MHRIFISATSGDLGSYRRVVRDVLLSKEVLPLVQDHFPPDYRSVIGLLEDKIRHCDAVICLVGFVYGQEPRQRPEDEPRRSYSQLEYDIARQLGKPVYLFLAREGCPCDAQVEEAEELRQLQRAYREQLRHSDQVRSAFSSVADLERQIGAIAFPLPLTGDEPTAPTPNNLPYSSLGTLFKGRDAFLATLRGSLLAAPSHAAALVPKTAIHGLGGVGKTRLAVEYAWRHRAEYTALLFVLADTPANLRRNLAALTTPLILNLEEHQAQEEEVQVAAALRWLQTHPGWLLILDNVDAEDAAEAVETVLPQLRDGHVLITSRLSHWSQDIAPLELDVLAASDAVAFLLERTAGYRRATADDAADARLLARELDGLALALEQAGTYIHERRLSFAEYLQRWRSQEARVREWFDARLMHYPRSVAVTWETTLAQLDESARALLRLLAWLAPDPIPLLLFESEAASQIFAEAVAGPDGSTPASHADLEEARTALIKFSMARWEGNETLQVHRLVQEITRGRLVEEEQRFWLEQALRLVNAALPGDPPPNDVRSWPVWEPLQPHVVFVVGWADQAGIPEPTARLMNELGLFLKTKCVFVEVEPLYRRALSISEAVYGPTHPSVASGLSNLAALLWETNRVEEAEPLYRRALDIDEATYGPAHPSVASGLNDLGGLLREINHLEEAEALFRRALGIDEAAYGPTHPSVASGLSNLAGLLRETNRLAEAEPLYRRALGIDEAVYGPTHPRVATHLSNLAGLLQETNRLAEAEPLYRRALGIDEAVYGPTHPRVATRLNNLAGLLRETNRLAEAVPLYRRALAIVGAA
jgi:tetratricopeptide (TPR) repeat protein